MEHTGESFLSATPSFMSALGFMDGQDQDLTESSLDQTMHSAASSATRVRQLRSNPSATPLSTRRRDVSGIDPPGRDEHSDPSAHPNHADAPPAIPQAERTARALEFEPEDLPPLRTEIDIEPATEETSRVAGVGSIHPAARTSSVLGNDAEPGQPGNQPDSGELADNMPLQDFVVPDDDDLTEESDTDCLYSGIKRNTDEVSAVPSEANGNELIAESVPMHHDSLRADLGHPAGTHEEQRDLHNAPEVPIHGGGARHTSKAPIVEDNLLVDDQQGNASDASDASDSEWSNDDTEPRTPWRNNAPRGRVSFTPVSSTLRKAVLEAPERTQTFSIVDPFEPASEKLLLFGTEPLTTDETDVLNHFAHVAEIGFDCEDGPAASLVQRLVDTIRFQRHEIEEVKNREVLLSSAAVEDERVRCDLVQRRRSEVLNNILSRMESLPSHMQGVASVHAKTQERRTSRSAEIESQLGEQQVILQKYANLARSKGVPVEEHASPEDVFAALDALLVQASSEISPSRGSRAGDAQKEGGGSHHPQQETSSGKESSPGLKSRSSSDIPEHLSAEDYGERLLELERIVKSSQERYDELLQKKVDLELELSELKRPQSQSQGPDSSPEDLTDSDHPTMIELKERNRDLIARVSSLESTMTSLKELRDRLTTERDQLEATCGRLQHDFENASEKVRALSSTRDQLKDKVDAISHAKDLAVEERERLEAESETLTKKHESVYHELFVSLTDTVNHLQEKEAECNKLRLDLEQQHKDLTDQKNMNENLTRAVTELEGALLSSSEDKLANCRQARPESFSRDAPAPRHQDASRSPPSAHAKPSEQLPLPPSPDRESGPGLFSKRHSSGPPTLLAGNEETAPHLKGKEICENQQSRSQRRSPCRSIQDLVDQAVELKPKDLRIMIDEARQEAEHWRQLALSAQASVQKLVAQESRPKNSLAVGDRRVEMEDGFLAKLSKHVGLASTLTSKELVERLIHRVESLMAERERFATKLQLLQDIIVDRDKKFATVRCELRAEISSLSAELAVVEKERARAEEDREAAEVRITEMIKRDFRDSVSSFHDDETRRSLIPDLTMDSSSDYYGFTSFEDPSIQAAIQSLTALIGSKEALDARNRELVARLNQALNRDGAQQGSGASSKALLIESRSLYNDMQKLVTLQQGTIQQLLGASRSDSVSVRSPSTANTVEAVAQCAAASNSGRDAPVARSPLRSEVEYTADVTASSRRVSGLAERRQSFVQGTDFLRCQLQQQRELAEERSRSNMKLSAVVREMESEVSLAREARERAEEELNANVTSTKQWIARLAEIAGVSAELNEIELTLQQMVVSLRKQIWSLKHAQDRGNMLEKRLTNAVAQKRVLSYVIHLYRTKYRFDIFDTSSRERVTPVARLRKLVFAIVAANRVQLAAKEIKSESEASRTAAPTYVSVSLSFNLPDAPNLLETLPGPAVPMDSAALAQAALPKLQSSLAERDEEIDHLRAAISALESAPARDVAGFNENVPPEPFDVKDDLLQRKDDLSRRLRKCIRQREELNLRLAHERKDKQALELRVARYADKLASYKQRLSRAKADADARDRTYKAAISYLKHKAERAVHNTSNTVQDELDTDALLSREYRDDIPASRRSSSLPPRPPSHRRDSGRSTDGLPRAHVPSSQFQSQIDSVREEMATLRADDPRLIELQDYVGALERASGHFPTSARPPLRLTPSQQTRVDTPR